MFQKFPPKIYKMSLFYHHLKELSYHSASIFINPLVKQQIITLFFNFAYSRSRSSPNKFRENVCWNHYDLSGSILGNFYRKSNCKSYRYLVIRIMLKHAFVVAISAKLLCLCMNCYTLTVLETAGEFQSLDVRLC